mmetsp:Transcript_18712/g.71163  ORF Transcript_18712/g.71163 Transcript_18712/m.71163 type:complete len:551 (-) Transcript_18712:1468-3120(-)
MQAVVLDGHQLACLGGRQVGQLDVEQGHGSARLPKGDAAGRGQGDLLVEGHGDARQVHRRGRGPQGRRGGDRQRGHAVGNGDEGPHGVAACGRRAVLRRGDKGGRRVPGAVNEGAGRHRDEEAGEGLRDGPSRKRHSREAARDPDLGSHSHAGRRNFGVLRSLGPDGNRGAAAAGRLGDGSAVHGLAELQAELPEPHVGVVGARGWGHGQHLGRDPVRGADSVAAGCQHCHVGIAGAVADSAGRKNHVVRRVGRCPATAGGASWQGHADEAGEAVLGRACGIGRGGGPNGKRGRGHGHHRRAVGRVDERQHHSLRRRVHVNVFGEGPHQGRGGQGRARVHAPVHAADHGHCGRDGLVGIRLKLPAHRGGAERVARAVEHQAGGQAGAEASAVLLQRARRQPKPHRVSGHGGGGARGVHHRKGKAGHRVPDLHCALSAAHRLVEAQNDVPGPQRHRLRPDCRVRGRNGRGQRVDAREGPSHLGGRVAGRVCEAARRNGGRDAGCADRHPRGVGRRCGSRVLHCRQQREPRAGGPLEARGVARGERRGCSSV